MVGGVGGGVSLDRNLRDMMDPMVDSDTNLVNNRGSVSISDWSSMGNSRSSICGMMSNNRGSISNNRGSMGNNRGSMGKSRSGIGGIGSMGNGWGSNSMSSRVNTSY